MMRYVWQGLGVAALVAALGGAATAQDGVKVIKTGDGKNLNVISNSGNGQGNSIIVNGDGSGGTTIINGYPNGVGNKIIIDGKEVIDQPGVIDPNWKMPADINQFIPANVRPWMDPGVARPWLPEANTVPAPGAVVYKGKANPFYQFTVFSPEMNCQLYWDARTLRFFRYVEAEDSYRPVQWVPDMPPMGEPK
jgi:hypothetical protein